MRLYTKPEMDTYPLLAYCILQAKYLDYEACSSSFNVERKIAEVLFQGFALIRFLHIQRLLLFLVCITNFTSKLITSLAWFSFHLVIKMAMYVPRSSALYLFSELVFDPLVWNIFLIRNQLPSVEESWDHPPELVNSTGMIRAHL